MEITLRRQAALVTGASSGPGEAIEQRLALEALRPLIHYRQDRGAAELPLPMLARIADTKEQPDPGGDPLYSNASAREGWAPVLSATDEQR